MKFEFDRNKSQKNKIKHNIGFNEAQKLWKDPFRVEIHAKHIDEPRVLVIAKLNKVIWSAIVTYREDVVRIISVRKSRENEKEIYYSK